MDLTAIREIVALTAYSERFKLPSYSQSFECWNARIYSNMFEYAYLVSMIDNLNVDCLNIFE